MSNDVSANLPKIYQFLSQKGGIEAADSNGDGAVTKAEFRTFMEDFEWDGETTEAGKNDLINSFWASIDTDQSSSKISGTKVKNKNALDSKEMAAMADRVEMYETLNSCS